MPVKARGLHMHSNANPEYRMSNKVYPPSAAPEATREFRMMRFKNFAPPSTFIIRYSTFCCSLFNFLAVCKEVTAF